MALPIINDKQGVLGFRVNEAVNFQPGATTDSTITAWAASGLPAGLSINTSTGLISGAVAVPGYWVVGVSATNTTGQSAPVFFTFGILAGAGTVVTPGGSDTGIDLDFDVVTGLVTLSGGAPATAVGDEVPPLFYAKTGDVRLLNLRFFKNAVQIDPDPATIRFALKEFDPDGRLMNASAFVKVSSGATAYFKLPISLTVPAVIAAIENYQADRGSRFTALADIEITQTVSIAGVTSLVITSRTFGLQLARDLADR